jgi:putative hydrolase of the HAD superfamily
MPWRAVLFDFFNTLTTSVRRGPHHVRIARLLGCDYQALVEVLDRTFLDRARGSYGMAHDGLRIVAQLAGGRPSRTEVGTAVRARIAAVRADGSLRPDAVSTLRTVRQMGLRTAVVSDCWFELPVFLPTLPIAPLLDAQVYSVRVGVTKPHPAMYLTACAALGVEPHECLYVGDGGSLELSGAQAMGMTAVRLAAPDLGQHLTFNAEPRWDGLTVRALGEVPALLTRTREMAGV